MRKWKILRCSGGKRNLLFLSAAISASTHASRMFPSKSKHRRSQYKTHTCCKVRVHYDVTTQKYESLAMKQVSKYLLLFNAKLFKIYALRSETKTFIKNYELQPRGFAISILKQSWVKILVKDVLLNDILKKQACSLRLFTWRTWFKLWWAQGWQIDIWN